MSKSLGIPVKLLHEAEGHVVTVEIKSGETYRGTLIEAEDNWNVQLENITYTAKVSFIRTFPVSSLNFHISCSMQVSQCTSEACRMTNF